MIDADSFREIERVFNAVCDLPPTDQEAKLIELLPDNESLRSEVIELLRVDDRVASGKGLTPTSVRAEFEAAVTAPHDDPDEIGGYRIVGRLGQGGMGVVYEAEQQSPKRLVALKVLRPGLYTPDLIRRFEFEAEALGRLRHPSIAQVYEAGIAEGRDGPSPYFVMELVQGSVLTDWLRGKSIKERIATIADLCDAVQHAHARGVIHRDLKPGNIMVTDEGLPKVLDFGVARALDAEPEQNTLHTQAGQLVGTLPYMSPEQVAGEPDGADTRTDVYALGVVLFEVLTGDTPHDMQALGLIEAVELIRGTPAAKLSRRDPKLRGDIEIITAKALELDRERRYQTAAELGEDLRRYLAGQTITARPPSAVYQISRVARRNLPVTLASCVALLTLIAAVVVVSLALNESVQQRAEAVAQREEADRQRAAAEMQRAEAEAQREEADRQRAEAELQREEAERQRAEAEIQRAEAVAQREEANRRAAIAEAVTGFFNNDVLASLEPNQLGHEVTVRKALDTAAERLPERFHDEPVTGAAIRNNIANVYHVLGEFDKAERFATESRDLFLAELGKSHELTRFAQQDIGAINRDMGNFEVAREALTESLSVRDESIGPSADETLENIIMLAEVERDGFGDIESAQAWLDEFDRRRPTDHSDDNPVAVYADMTRGGMALAARDYETAAAAYQRVAEAREGIYGETHSGTLTAWANAAVAYEALERYDEAEEIYLRVLDIEERMGGKDNPDRLPTAHNLAFLYQSTGRYELAEELFRDTLERCKRVFGPVHPGTLTCTESLASLYRDTDRIEQAVELLESAYNTAAAELGEAAPPIIEMATNLAVMYVEVRRPDDGEALLAVTVPAVRELVPPGHAFLGNSLLKWGTCLAAIGETDSAIAKLTEAFEILSDAPGQTQADDAREAADRIASIHETAGNASEATRWRELASGLGAETPD